MQTTSFSTADWINDACRSKPPNESFDKYLTQLEAKLQLRCEELEKEIENHAQQLAREIPQVLVSAARIKGEVAGLEESVKETAGELKERAQIANFVVSGVQDLHQIKSNMQSACNSLKEATELSELFVRVDAIFNTGDIFAMAKIMATMHRSLKLVGNVPEFESGKRKMKVLEENLISSVKQQLIAAISQRRDEQVTKLCEILVSLEAVETLIESFLSVKLKELEPALKLVIARIDSALTETEINAVEATKEAYRLILEKTQEEMEWCARLFPNKSTELLTALLETLLEKFRPSIDGILTRFQSVEVSISILEAILGFLSDLIVVFPAAPSTDRLLLVALQPIDQRIPQSVQLERAGLTKLINDIDMTKTGPQQAIEIMESTLISIFRFAESAVTRSVRFTGGTEIMQLSTEIEFCLTRFVSVLTTGLKYFRSSVLSQDLSEITDDSANLSSVLQLLKIGSSLAEVLLQLQEKLREVSVQILAELRRDRSELDVFTLAQRRLASAKLTELLQRLKKEDWRRLSGIDRSIQGFDAAADALIFDVFMNRPRTLFKGFGNIPEWSQGKETSSESTLLPQFSTYPLHYVSLFGEYLMMVPQQLEALVSADVEIDEGKVEREEEMASALLTKIINGVTELYADEILSVAQLTPAGVSQLTCDLQYFANVLSAMGSTFPSPLAAVYEALKMSIEELNRMTKEVAIDRNRLFIFQTVEKMRTIK